jgi:hypothetical protein
MPNWGLRGKLTYANVMATIAVFIALGGASYAATQLPKNSVGTKQLKNNAVTGAKIKNQAVTAAKIADGTLTGMQINSSTLGTVPNAANAANSANSQALDGQSAGQLSGASKLRCPSGMALYDGVCYQEAAHKAIDWAFAAIGCMEEQLRLPTLGELIGFEGNSLTVSPPAEWTEPEWTGPAGGLAWIASASKAGAPNWSVAELETATYPYRCVTLASN